MKKIALITGASSGFGEAIAKSLAKLNFNLILTARNETKLQKVIQDIQSQYPTQIVPLIFDVQDFDACEKRLNLTFKPNWLYVTNRAYYFLIKGSIDVQRGKHNEAEEWFNKAQALKLPTDNEKAMIFIQMINIHVSKNRWTQANNAYRELKKLKLTGDMFKDQIKMIDDVLKQQGKMKTMGQMDQRMMFRPGGKRRTPRMR